MTTGGASMSDSAGRVQSWAANWYKTRRHVVMGRHALCSPYTTVWPEGRQGSHAIPPADSPEVMALTPCGLCTRKVKP